MTRKCALCKETNYKKNNCSFFSAPKDVETRTKWQIALKNYTVTNDTYICSSHFHKNDIITHWVSGVPPQVIKIKYKKCRLRPGAVPSKNLHSVNNLKLMNKDVLDRYKVDAEDFSTFKKKQALKENKTILPSKRKRNLNDDEDACNKSTNRYYHTYSKAQDYEENNQSDNILLRDTDKRDVDISMQLKESRVAKKEPVEILEYNNSSIFDFEEATTESVHTDEEKNHVSSNKSSHMNIFTQTVECNTRKYNSSKQSLVHSYLKNKTVNNILKTRNEIGENEILFEDFLEVYTEVSIPRGWSCLVTSEGHSTTVVYLCMGITIDGLPFVEKQVFIRSDMILHYAVANREIDPLTHNLVKERKHTKVRNSLDIEVLIDEFDQRVVCQGIYDPVDYENIDITKVIYKDGIKWRHISCPLIISNNSSRCTKCTTLSRMLLLQKS